MRERLNQIAWILGYILMLGESLWLFCSFLTVMGVMVFGLGTHSAFAQQYLHYLALALSLFAKSLIPGVLVGFWLLFRKDDFAWLPPALVLIPLVGVSQSTSLTVLARSTGQQVSLVTLVASIAWLAILSVGLFSLSRKKAVLWWMLAAILLGVAWGIWLRFQLG